MYRDVGTFDEPPAGLGWPNASAIPDRAVLSVVVLRLARVAAPAISLTILLAAIVQLNHLDLSKIRAMVPTGPAFWGIFTVCYAVPPLADWLIFHKLWKLPTSGFFALVRKLIGNELLLGYIGELYFYSWARKRLAMAGAPFGAVKDVAILSAMVGNCATLVMVVIAYPLFGYLDLGVDRQTVGLSVAVVMATSLAVMLFRRRLFSLPFAELRFVIFIQLARITATLLLGICMWHIVLPAVSAGAWMLLATLRLLVSRLPLLPNKELVFAGIAVVVVGRQVDVAQLMTLMAALILATHLALGALLTSADVLRWRQL